MTDPRPALARLLYALRYDLPVLTVEREWDALPPAVQHTVLRDADRVLTLLALHGYQRPQPYVAGTIPPAATRGPGLTPVDFEAIRPRLDAVFADPEDADAEC